MPSDIVLYAYTIFGCMPFLSSELAEYLGISPKSAGILLNRAYSDGGQISRTWRKARPNRNVWEWRVTYGADHYSI